MLEVEQKFTQVDFETLRHKLRNLGATGTERHLQEDEYFNAPDRDFATTGEAFRLRRSDDQILLTYKGKRQQKEVKVRPEIEIPLALGCESLAHARQLLLHLGYRPVAIVRKRRESYRLDHQGQRVNICLDEVEELGRFAEVEMVGPEDQHEQMAAQVQALAKHLGLSQPEPRSYLRQLLEKRAAVPAARQPLVVTTPDELRTVLREQRRLGRSIGLVPTMGALHLGHRSLIEASRGRDGCVVVSIFVNPTQFGPHEDLARYPRPFEADVALCREAGVDVIFHPTVETIYPADYCTYVEVTQLQDILEGASRPGHFRGVATVVLKLFHLVQPDRAYFGQKDAQQVRIVQQMVRDLAVPVELVVCPTSREADGLARSSRNVYLDPHQRAAATVLYRALQEARQLVEQGQRDAAVIQAAMRRRIEAEPQAQLDYAVVVDAQTLQPMTTIAGPVLLAVAVRFGSTRLIDNILIDHILDS